MLLRLRMQLPIERFYSRNQQRCKFIGIKEIVYIKKSWLVWGTNIANPFIICEHWFGSCDVMGKHFLNMFTMVIVQVIDPARNIDRESKLFNYLLPSTII